MFQKCWKSKQEKEREKKHFFNCLLQSSGVVKHSPLNSQVALTTDQHLWSYCIFNWLRLVKCCTQRLGLARYCNRGFGGPFRLVLLSWHCWEWLTLCWLRSLEFLWRGCHTRGLQGYRSLSRLWAVEWLSAPAEMSAVSAEDSPIFCLHFIHAGSHIC